MDQVGIADARLVVTGEVARVVERARGELAQDEAERQLVDQGGEQHSPQKRHPDQGLPLVRPQIRALRDPELKEHRGEQEQAGVDGGQDPGGEGVVSAGQEEEPAFDRERPRRRQAERRGRSANRQAVQGVEVADGREHTEAGNLDVDSRQGDGVERGREAQGHPHPPCDHGPFEPENHRRER